MAEHKQDVAYLWDMLDAAEAAVRMVGSMPYQEYERDRQLQLAVERLVEIIGEAARNVSASFKAEHPEIPWSLIIAQRNVIAHDYGDIKQDRIWALTQRHLPELIEKIQPFVPALPDDKGE